MIVNRTRIPTHSLTPLIEWVRERMNEDARKANILIMYKRRYARIGGFANRFAWGRGRKSRGLPQNEPLVTIEVGATWEQRGYPITETYKKRAGSMTYDNWQEHFVSLIAHELRHIEQYALGERKGTIRKMLSGGSMEVDAERHAMRLLAEFKKAPIGEELSHAAKKEGKECPRCHKVGDIATMFGYRTIKGKSVIPQSYCFDCRRSHARTHRKQIIDW